MPYYHVYIAFTDKSGKQDSMFKFNLLQEDLKKIVVSPYMNNKSFLFVGRRVHPSSIDILNIYESEKRAEEYVLPNGKSVFDDDVNNTYISKCFSRQKVEGIQVCTYDFITSLEEEARKTPVKPLGKKEKVFIVHGRDDKQALRLQKYLTRTLKIDAEMFEDFKERSSSNTIIEQLEYIRDNIGYAFVIVTPDDLGYLREDIEKCRTRVLIGKRSVAVKSVCEILDKFQTRARQNVVFEHGIFTGALGRDKVCCLLQKGTKEKPSDIDGILYVDFNKSVRETFPEITEKLKKIGLVKA